MPKRAESSGNTPRSPRSPARTPEAREQQLVSAAMDLAEQQLRDGTASAQVITHFLKLGSSRETLEQDRLVNENQLTSAKIEQLGSQKHIEEMYGKALAAMSAYSGQVVEEELDD